MPSRGLVGDVDDDPTSGLQLSGGPGADEPMGVHGSGTEAASSPTASQEETG